MSNDYQVLIYGASGYTGKLVAESLARRNIPFYFAGQVLLALSVRDSPEKNKIKAQ